MTDILSDYVDPSDWENGKPPADPRIFAKELDFHDGKITWDEFERWKQEYLDGKPTNRTRSSTESTEKP